MITFLTGSFLSLACVCQKIPGRDEQELYRIKAPTDWSCIRNTDSSSLQDTKNPITEFFIIDNDGEIRITIHNFPSETAIDRVPPTAQVARWERQFNTLDSTYQSVSRQSFSGFFGLLYEGKGLMNGKEITMMAWALQIGNEHYRTLSRALYPLEMRSDVTIKAIGPSKLMTRYREKIIDFARSFELIEEIPAPR